jgi:hypothetical protein
MAATLCHAFVASLFLSIRAIVIRHSKHYSVSILLKFKSHRTRVITLAERRGDPMADLLFGRFKPSESEVKVREGFYASLNGASSALSHW